MQECFTLGANVDARSSQFDPGHLAVQLHFGLDVGNGSKFRHD
jgi:hypothetical protein